MDATATTSLVTTTLSNFSSSAFTIVSAVIGVGLAFLLFRFGWNKIREAVDDYSIRHDKAYQKYLHMTPKQRRLDFIKYPPRY